MDGGAAEGKVLVVDDEPGVLKVFDHVLSTGGFEVEAVSNGRDAIARIQSHSFDAVVSDVSMPELGGIALLRAVRELDLDVPVILVTGSPSVESAVQAVEYGALRYITKPVQVDDLIATVRKAVRLGRMARVKREAIEHLGGDGRQLGDRAGLEIAFNAALASVRLVYQPIVHHGAREVFAYEALLRSGEPRLPHPGAILDAAERLGRLHVLGRVVRKQVASLLASSPKSLIFVNLHPEDLQDEDLFREDAPLSGFAKQVVLEATERASLEHMLDVSHRVARLRSLGYRVAVDDIGAGYAGLNSIAHLEPEFMKIDMALIRGINADVTRQKVVGAMVRLCREMDAMVVAEGIETAAERDSVAELGCDLLQGFFFARPSEPFVDVTF